MEYFFEESLSVSFNDDIPVKVREAYDDWHKCISDLLLPVINDPDKVVM